MGGALEQGRFPFDRLVAITKWVEIEEALADSQLARLSNLSPYAGELNSIVGYDQTA